MVKPEQPYVVVLAGGEGNRLASLTRALYGQDLPKQFAVLAGERSLLQTTIERAAQLTSLDRISVIVSAHHEALAREQLTPYPGVELVVQPKNLDTAPGMLLPLVKILVRAQNARVVFLPSDHYVVDVEPMIEALQSTSRAGLRNRLALIGVTPTGPEVEYGWIVRGNQIGRSGAFDVDRFHEKPASPIAHELWNRGGLWNTFIQAGAATLFWELARKYLPVHAAALERYAVAIGSSEESSELDAAYRVMPKASFSHDVLAHAGSLAVLPVDDTGWSDWGSPQRVFASLVGTPCHDRLVGRIQGAVAAA
ncbi:MAG TPA: sugar phosphate nucleotidyltransferase [Kofleriaceae bacterium]